MSVNDRPLPDSAPIARGSPLGKALDGYNVPPLSAGFAARVLAAAEARPAVLPDLRRPARSRRWRIGQRLAIGAISFGALASAAAATGLLQRLDLPVQVAGTVWASMTGTATAAPKPAPRKPAAAAAAAADTAAAPVTIQGPIDTPEELAETLRRVDQVRAGRREERRRVIDQRIQSEIERRRAAGLRVPTPEQEARLRAKIEQVVTAREQRADAVAAARRQALQRKVEAGEPVTRDDLVRPLQGAAPGAPRAERLRDAAPAERRQILRNLPPEERRALIEKLRARRAARLGTPAPAVSPTPGEPAAPATSEPAPQPAPPPSAEE